MITIPRHWRLALLLALLMQALPSTVPVAGSIQPALADDDGGGDGGGGDSGGSGDGGSDDGGSDDGGSDDGASDDGGGVSGGGDGSDAGGGNSGAGGASSGDGDDDHEYAWRERRAGHIRSLKEVLEDLRKQGVTVLDVKLRRRHGRSRYEIRLLDRRNRLRVKSLPARRRSRKAYNFNRD